MTSEEVVVQSLLQAAGANTAEALRTLADVRCAAAEARCKLTERDPGGLGHPERRIISAAMRNEKTGRVIMCVRHRDEIWRASLLPGERPQDYDDGFVCSQRQFLSREEAWPVALSAGQIIRWCGGGCPRTGVLYSENIC